MNTARLQVRINLEELSVLQTALRHQEERNSALLNENNRLIEKSREFLGQVNTQAQTIERQNQKIQALQNKVATQGAEALEAFRKCFHEPMFETICSYMLPFVAVELRSEKEEESSE